MLLKKILCHFHTVIEWINLKYNESFYSNDIKGIVNEFWFFKYYLSIRLPSLLRIFVINYLLLISDYKFSITLNYNTSQNSDPFKATSLSTFTVFGYFLFFVNYCRHVFMSKKFWKTNIFDHSTPAGKTVYPFIGVFDRFWL